MLTSHQIANLSDFQKNGYANILQAILFYLLQTDEHSRPTFKEEVYSRIEGSGLYSKQKTELFRFFQTELEGATITKI